MSEAQRGPSGRGEAGFHGKDVRSDVHVAVEARDGGGLAIELESKVEAYYGEAILEQCRAELGALGVENAAVVIRDGGAKKSHILASTILA